MTQLCVSIVSEIFSDMILLFHSDFEISRILEIAFALLLASLVPEAYVIVGKKNLYRP